MTDHRFEYDETLLASCASSLERSDIDISIHEHACWTLLQQQYANHYGRPLPNKADETHIHSFLESILLVHSHNTRRSLSNHHYDEWFDLWENQDWETQTTQEGMVVVRLHDQESIAKAASVLLHSDDVLPTRKRRLHHDGPMKTFVSPFGNDYPHLKIASDNEFTVDSITEGKDKHKHHHTRDDSFKTYLNWASTRNPDGVDICHDVHDQVRSHL